MPDVFELSLEFQDTRLRGAQSGLEALGASLDKGLKRMPRVARDELRNFLDSVRLAMQNRHSRQYTEGYRGPEGPRAGRLQRRSGKLTKNIRVKVKGVTFQGLQGEIGVRGKAGVYAPVHEFGAVIKPKRAQYLVIPLSAALNAQGVPKKRSPRSWKNTFIARSKKGNLLIFQRRRGARKPVPLYVLKKQVRIPPRLGLGATLERGVPVFQDVLMDKLLKTLLDGGL